MICGACKLTLTKGTIDRSDYHDAILSDAERDGGTILTCIAKATGAVEIDA